MKQIILAAVLALTASLALANGNDNGPTNNNTYNTTNNTYTTDSHNTTNQGGTGVGVGIGVSKSNANSSSKSNANSSSKSYATVGDITNTAKGGNAEQKQAQAQIQSATSEGSEAAASNGDNTLQVNEAQQKLQAPAFGIQYAAPTAPCVVTHGVAVSVPGGGGSFGSGTVDKGCERREWARMLGGEAGMRIACSDPIVYDAVPACEQYRKNPAPAAAAWPGTRTPAVAKGGRQ